MPSPQPMHRRFEDKPALKALLLSLPRPIGVSEKDYTDILFSLDTFASVPLAAHWWEDEPTPDLLIEVPEMKQDAYKDAVQTYIALLFARTHPTPDADQSSLRTAMWDVICYLRRRARCVEALARLSSLSPIDPHPKAFSGTEYKAFLDGEFPRLRSVLITDFQSALALPFSHDTCQDDRAHIATLIEDESLLTARLCDITPPWRTFLDSPPDAEHWQFGQARKCLSRFCRYVLSLTPTQRLRFRKYVREPRAWSGIYASLEFDDANIPEPIKSALLTALNKERHATPSACKQIAERFRAISGEIDRGIIVYRGATFTRTFSNVEAGAVREGVKNFISFRRAPCPLTVTKTPTGFLASAGNIFLFLEEAELPPLGASFDVALPLYAAERMRKDAFDLRAVLYSTAQGFTNLEQKRILSRGKRSKPLPATPDAAHAPQPSVQDLSTAPKEAPSPLSPGTRVFHRLWGAGQLLGCDRRASDAFWRVSFDQGEKSLSEHWLLSNCTLL